MNELKIINEQEVLGKEFKIYGSIENPLFLAKDVASWIEHSNPRVMLKTVDEDEKVVNNVYTLGGNQESWFLTEDGLYEVLMQSRKPIAKEFKKEVKKILKQIRLTGGAVIEDREEEFINIYFPSFTDDVKLAMVQDLRSQNKVLKEQTKVLNQENDLLSEKTLLWADRSFINASVRQYAGYACKGNFGEAWIDFKKELLYKHGVNLNSRITKYLNETGKKTKPKTLDMLDNSEVPNAVSTIVAMCRDKDVDISYLIKKLSVGDVN